MKLKSLLTLVLFTCISLSAIAQKQTAINKKHDWIIESTSDTRLNFTTNVPQHGIAMIVNPPKTDFGVILVDDKAAEKWNTPLKGFPLAIGYFKGKIVVVSASERTLFGGVSKKYSIATLDPATGKLLSEKLIYEGNKKNYESARFIFNRKGTQFTFVVVSYITEKETRSVSSYTIISFDEEFNHSKIFTPELPEGKKFTSNMTDDGNFMLAVLDEAANAINYSLIDVIKGKTIGSSKLSFNSKIDFKKIEHLNTYHPETRTHFVSILAGLLDNKKNKTLIIGKIDLNSGIVASKEETFTPDDIKSLSRAHVAVNKKLNDMSFSMNYLTFLNTRIIGDKLAVELTNQYMTYSNRGSFGTDGSVLIKFYNLDLSTLSHSFFPRTYLSASFEGSYLYYQLNKNILNIVGNTAFGAGSAYIPVIQSIDLTDGKVLSYNKIPNVEISGIYYIVTPSVEIFDDNKIFIPYMERPRALSKRKEVILQVIEN